MAALPGVREKLESIQKAAVEDGRLGADTASAGAAALMPSFSKGTVPLDDNGQPIIPKEQGVVPAFEAGHVPLPAGTETTSGTEPAAAPAPAPARPAEAPAPTAAPAPAAGAAAAEAAAEAIAEELAELVFHDPDLDVDVPIRVPKKFEETVKKGYGRRAAYDRTVSYLKNAEPVLRQMIEDGRINPILPLIQRALEDPAFGQYVTQGFERARQGLPLIEQARAEAAAAGAAMAAPAPVAPAAPEFDMFTDPNIAAVQARQEKIEADLAAWREAQAAEAETARQRQAMQNFNIQQMRDAHQDLALTYPGVFDPSKGDQDAAWQAAYRYANEAGYIQRYGLRAAIVFGGQQWRAMEAERLAATASPAAAALAEMDTRLLEGARQEARSAAATVSGGAVAPAAAVPVPPKPGTRNPDGTLKPQQQYMAEVTAWHQQYGALKG